MPAPRQFVPERCQRRIGQRVVADDDPVFPQRHARRPVAGGRVGARCNPDVLGVAFLTAVPRNHLAIERYRIDLADPRHAERALRDRDAARFLKQLVAIADAHDRRIDAAQHSVNTVQTGDFLLLLLPLGDDFRKNDESADAPFRRAPGTNLPAYPVGRSIRAEERVFLALFSRSPEAAPVDLFPALGKIGKDVVVAPSDNRRLVDTVVRNPSATCVQVSHVAVEHGDGGRAVFDEETQMLLAFPQRFLRPLALGHFPLQIGAVGADLLVEQIVLLSLRQLRRKRHQNALVVGIELLGAEFVGDIQPAKRIAGQGDRGRQE